jgi:Tfp pilus assembly protein PilX
MRRSAPIRPVKPSEEGYVLLAVIFLLVLLTIVQVTDLGYNNTQSLSFKPN